MSDHPVQSVSQTKAVSSLATLYIFRMLGLFMVLPILALAGDDYLGSSGFLLGVALGIYGLTQALLQIPFGMLSDRFGRKPLIAIGLLLFALGSLVAASADTMTGLIIGRALQGAGAIAGVIMAMVGDLTSVENRTKAMASIGASIGIAFTLALIIGPYLASLGGVRLVFWVTVGLSLVGLLVLFFLVPSPAQSTAPSQVSLDHLYSVLKRPQCVCLYIGAFVLHCVLMAFFVVVPVLLTEASVVKEHHSWVYLGVILCSFLVMVPMMIVGEKKQQVKPLFVSAIVMLMIALMVIAISTHRYGLILGLWIFFVGFNYLEANLPSLLTKHLSSENKGAGSGVFATCQFLGAAVGGIAGGWLYQNWQVMVTFGLASMLLVVWVFATRPMVIPARQAKV